MFRTCRLRTASVVCLHFDEAPPSGGVISNFWIFSNMLDYFVWLRIIDEGSLPEMRIWSTLLNESDLKWCIHLSRSLFLYFDSKGFDSKCFDSNILIIMPLIITTLILICLILTTLILMSLTLTTLILMNLILMNLMLMNLFLVFDSKAFLPALDF